LKAVGALKDGNGRRTFWRWLVHLQMCGKRSRTFQSWLVHCSFLSPHHHLPNISLDYLLSHLLTLNDWRLIVYIILATHLPCTYLLDFAHLTTIFPPHTTMHLSILGLYHMDLAIMKQKMFIFTQPSMW
jgi:hypothetical protein